MSENKGCGCGKKNAPPTPASPVTEQSDQSQQQEFRNAEPVDGGLKKKLTMIQSFATSIASRGISDNKVNKAEKQLRVLGCFGNKHSGGILPPCEHLKKSEVQEGQYYCGACGCGDKKMTWLLANGEEYSKLDYPKLHCPLGMPGFSNYTEAEEHESVPPITRKHFIENMSLADVASVQVTLPEMPIQTEELPKNQE
jgi:hypothetical protein